MMGIQTRACFCLNPPLDARRIEALFYALDEQGCRYNVWLPGEGRAYLVREEADVERAAEPLLDTAFTESHLEPQPRAERLAELAAWVATPGMTGLTFAWNLDGAVWPLHLYRDSHAPRVRILVVVEEYVFEELDQKQRIQRFQSLLVTMLQHLRPIVGVIGPEADLICNRYEDLAYRYWGYYLTLATLARWSEEDRQELQRVAAAYLPIDDQGVLVCATSFIAYQPQDETPEDHVFWQLLQRNPKC